MTVKIDYQPIVMFLKIIYNELNYQYSDTLKTSSIRIL